MVPEIFKIKKDTVSQWEAYIGHTAASFSIIYADWGYNDNVIFIFQFSKRRNISACTRRKLLNISRKKNIPCFLTFVRKF